MTREQLLAIVTAIVRCTDHIQSQLVENALDAERDGGGDLVEYIEIDDAVEIAKKIMDATGNRK